MRHPTQPATRPSPALPCTALPLPCGTWLQAKAKIDAAAIADGSEAISWADLMVLAAKVGCGFFGSLNRACHTASQETTARL